MTLSAKGEARGIQISSEYALGRGVSAVQGKLYDSLMGKAMPVGKLDKAQALRGRHNHQNAAAAYAACRALGVEPNVILAAIQSFPGLPHRLEVVANSGGISFVNDSKATNAQATEQALKAFPRVYWIAGGKAKYDGIDDLAPLFPRVAKAYLIGEAQDAFAKSLEGHAEAVKCGTLEIAVQDALRDASEAGEPDPVILLSPACGRLLQI